MPAISSEGDTRTEGLRDVYTVSRLNREARGLLEAGLPSLWITGELSNFSRPASGHWYFTLKDADAQVRCAMFRQRNLMVRVQPRDGMQVLLRARVGLYEARGDFQLIADHLEEAGEGELRRRFEALKLRLAGEGLFDAARKRPPPRFPRRIGIVTSPTGAALRDVLHVLARRCPAVPVLVYPVPVQGAGAAREIAAMLELADRRAEVDVLLLVRGGGSLEDLWAFNDESLARTLADLRAAGHQRHRPRGGFHDRRFRRRPARADAVGRGRTRGTGCRRLAHRARRDRPAPRRRDAARLAPAPGDGRARRPATRHAASVAAARAAHAAARRAADAGARGDAPRGRGARRAASPGSARNSRAVRRRRGSRHWPSASPMPGRACCRHCGTGFRSPAASSRAPRAGCTRPARWRRLRADTPSSPWRPTGAW